MVVLTGPTGVGKTELSLRLAEHWCCPILNADSRQVYRDIPIGTAAPTAEEQRRVKHYFVGTKGLDEEYNAGQFERDCLSVLESLQADSENGHVMAVLSGGSMMYIDAVCNGLDVFPDVPSDIRQQVREWYAEGGLTALQQRVQASDPVYWNQVDRNNPQRLMHCLEVTLVSGQPYSSYCRHTRAERPFAIVKVALNRDRKELYARIDARVEEMMRQGLEQEARSVWCEPVPNSLNTVGYKEMFSYFRGEITRDEAIRLIQQNSRHYAKRQMTWFRKDTDIHWIDASKDYEEQISILDRLVADTGRL